MSPRVLIVDDEPAIVRALSRQLNINYDITTAYSAEEAIRLVEGPGQFDVVVSDVTMPGLNGLDMIERIAELHPRCRFVVLTGNGDAETLTRAESMEPVCRVLRKPCDTQSIVLAINTASAMADVVAT